MHAPQPTQRSASITADDVLWNQILSSSSGTPFASMMSSRTSRAGSTCGSFPPLSSRSAVSTVSVGMSVPFEVAADTGRGEIVQRELARAHRAQDLGDRVVCLVDGLLEPHPRAEARVAQVAAERDVEGLLVGLFVLRHRRADADVGGLDLRARGLAPTHVELQTVQTVAACERQRLLQVGDELAPIGLHVVDRELAEGCARARDDRALERVGLGLVGLDEVLAQ